MDVCFRCELRLSLSRCEGPQKFQSMPRNAPAAPFIRDRS